MQFMRILRPFAFLVAALVVTHVHAQLCARPTANGLSWWAADGSAVDLIGPNPGTLAAGAGFGAGWVAQAFTFDGVDDHVAVPFNASFDFQLPLQFSIAAWVNAGSGPGSLRALVVKSPPSGLWDWGLFLTSDNQFMAGGNAHAAVTSNTTAVAGVWYHVAVTYQDSLWQLYVNGVREAAASGILISRSTGGLALARTGEAAGAADAFGGSLDEVEIFDRALTPCAVGALFDTGHAGQCKGDDDADGVSDIVDNCLRRPNAAQTDQDADGTGDDCDCAPADPATFAVPGEIARLQVGTSSKNGLSWCSAAAGAGNSTLHQLVRGIAAELPVGNGVSESCVVNGSTSPFATDTSVPAAGQGFWYLVRGRNACGTGTYGFSGLHGLPSTERTTTACP